MKIDLEKFICSLFSTKFSENEMASIKYWASMRYVDASLNVVIMAFKKALEQQGLEYKSGELIEIEKPKPKFKVGDLIIHNIARFVYKIQTVGIDGYGVMNLDGEKYEISRSKEEFYHLWTIQDAKPGDMLVDAGGNIGILKDYSGFYWHSFIYCGSNGNIYEPDHEGISGSHPTNGSKPVTKEQRNQIEKAILDAGYKWNAETLTLEKIEKSDTINFEELDKDKMAEEYLKCCKGAGLSPFIMDAIGSAYRKGLEDMFNKLKKKQRGTENSNKC